MADLFDYERAEAIASQLLTKFGGEFADVSKVTVTGGEYDPVDGSTQPEIRTLTPMLAVKTSIDSEQWSFSETDENNQYEITADAFQVVASSAVAVAQGDLLSVEGTDYEAKRVKTVKPAGVVVLYKILVDTL